VSNRPIANDPWLATATLSEAIGWLEELGAWKKTTTARAAAIATPAAGIANVNKRNLGFTATASAINRSLSEDLHAIESVSSGSRFTID
jgi:hypothetical protein